MSYWNYEEGDNIICPYCAEEYEPRVAKSRV